jgi:acyl-CoA thioester hydrolase
VVSDAVKQNLTYRGAIYPWHCDQMGHANAAWYVGRFDEATWGFLLDCGLPGSYFRSTNWGMVATELKVTYRRELLAGDVISVFTKLSAITKRSVRIEHALRLDESGAIAAVCEVTAAHIDRSRRKVAPFPPAILTSLRHRLHVQCEGSVPG